MSADQTAKPSASAQYEAVRAASPNPECECANCASYRAAVLTLKAIADGQ